MILNVGSRPVGAAACRSLVEGNRLGGGVNGLYLISSLLPGGGGGNGLNERFLMVGMVPMSVPAASFRRTRRLTLRK
jgi:hypothetical protein